MTQEFDSAALELIDNAYGLSGVDAEQQTVLEDGHVQQLLPIDAIARRSRSPFRFGIFSLAFENDHGVASTLQSFIDPYNPQNVHNGYPGTVDPRKAEIWLLSATCRTNVGANVGIALVGVDAQAGLQGASDTASGGAVTPATVQDFWGFWDDFTISPLTVLEFGRNSVSGLMSLPFRRRLSAGEPILFRSTVTGAADVSMKATCFIGPVALGQDLF